MISLSFDSDLALKLAKDFKLAPPETDACTSTRSTVLGTRVRLFTLSIPTSLPTVFVNVPICVAFEAKAGIEGTLFKLSDKGRIDIKVGDGAAPRITQGAPADSATRLSDDSAIWAPISSADSKLSVAMVSVDARASLAAEVAVEVSGLGVVATGLSNSFRGTAFANGEVAPAVAEIPTSILEMKASPLYCLDVGVTANYELTAYASLPALKFLFAQGDTVTKKLFEAELWKQSGKVGTCDVKVATSATIYSDEQNPGQLSTLHVSVAKSDVASQKLWDALAVTGIVDVMNEAGVVCSFTLDANGLGSCSHDFGPEPHAEYLTATYRGDTHFKPSTSRPHGHRVGEILGYDIYFDWVRATGGTPDQPCLKPINRGFWGNEELIPVPNKPGFYHGRLADIAPGGLDDIEVQVPGGSRGLSPGLQKLGFTQFTLNFDVASVSGSAVLSSVGCDRYYELSGLIH